MSPTAHRLLVYFSWSREGEAEAPLTEISDRFPAIFELRRLFYPRFEPLADDGQSDQGILGFLDHVQRPNFVEFANLAEELTGEAVATLERVPADGTPRLLDDAAIGTADTIVVISFDSFRTEQQASQSEIDAVRRFLATPGHVIFVCPHHDIGNVADVEHEKVLAAQVAEHAHHGDKGIPPRQGFGGFARTLLAGLGVPVENRFGLRPATGPDGSASPVEIERHLDRTGLLNGVTTFNSHAHLPQLERLGEGRALLDVLARQAIDLSAPPHPFTDTGRLSFDALLQSAPDAFPGTLFVCDTTMFSSTAGGIESLRRLWSNLLQRH